MNKEQFKIVGHTIGINTYHAELSSRKKDKYLPDEFYRNYFCAGNEKHHDFKILEELEQLGIMQRWEQMNNIYFCVTDLGIVAFRNQFTEHITNHYKPLSRGKERYQNYLDSDCCETFAEWAGIYTPIEQYAGNSYSYERRAIDGYTYDYYHHKERPVGVRFYSSKYIKVVGKWCENKKLAKESYKEALKRYKKELKEETNDRK